MVYLSVSTMTCDVSATHEFVGLWVFLTRDQRVPCVGSTQKLEFVTLIFPAFYPTYAHKHRNIARTICVTFPCQCFSSVCSALLIRGLTTRNVTLKSSGIFPWRSTFDFSIEFSIPMSPRFKHNKGQIN